MRKRANIVWTVWLCLACGFFSYSAARLFTEPSARAWFNSDFWSEWLRVGKAMRITSANYFEPSLVNYEKLGANAITGITDNLDDYSEYLPPTELKDLTNRTDQVFVGIGVTFQLFEGAPTIMQVIPGGGAAKAKVEPGDRILKIDGKTITGKSESALRKQLRGEVGTQVTLHLQRPGTEAGFDVQIQRKEVMSPSVFFPKMLGDGIGYIRVSQFGKLTTSEIITALNELAKQDMTKLVIDLRNNPGGAVTAATDVVGLFTPKGTVVTTAQGRAASVKAEFSTRVEPRYRDMPLVVIVNRESASAAEIVSGALQDLKRATVVGDRTFGKGVMQTVFNLDTTHGLKLTSARYHLPSGRSIQGDGVQPDIYQPMSLRDQVMVSIFETWLQLGREEEFEKRFRQPPPGDAQLDAAVDFLKMLPSPAPKKTK